MLGRFMARLAGERYLGGGADGAALARELTRRARPPARACGQGGAAARDGAGRPARRVRSRADEPAVPGAGHGADLRAPAHAGELGADWQTRFRAFDLNAAAAASLGQVHRVVARDGRRLACKLQYPDMDVAVDPDLRGLDLALRVLQQYQQALTMGSVRAELEARLREELDYAQEAGHMALYRDMLRGEAAITVPEPVLGLSTRRLLTMTWLDGEPIQSRMDRASAERAITMFRAWYVPFFEYGVLHGDPHLGNYTVRADGGLNLLDFGCIRVFPPALVAAAIDLYHAVDAGDEALAEHAYRTWRFENLTREVLNALNVWAQFVFEPLLADKRQTLGELTDDIHGREVAERVIAELHRAGGVDIPREFVIMDRAAIGLGAVFLRLQAEVNWHRLFNEVIASFDPAALARRQAELLARHGVPLPR